MPKQGLLNEIQMPKTRRRVLLALKEHGNLTADELGERIGISAVAVRRHLDTLQRDHLVAYDEVQRGMGRPSFVYKLTNKADHLFPRDYQGLAEDMLIIIQKTYGDEAVATIFKERTRRIRDVYAQHIQGETLQERLEELVELRRADGFMATWEAQADGSFILSEQNCPIHHVAQSCGQACHEDLALFLHLLKAHVVRTDHLIQGDTTCSYLITPLENPASPPAVNGH